MQEALARVDLLQGGLYWWRVLEVGEVRGMFGGFDGEAVS